MGAVGVELLGCLSKSYGVLRDLGCLNLTHVAVSYMTLVRSAIAAGEVGVVVVQHA